VDPNGSFDSKTGRATIHGTVTSTRATIVDVHGTLRQKLGRTRIIQGTFGLSVPCTNSATWTATVESATGAFGGGAAEVSLDANAVDPITLESTNATMDVVAKLNGSKR